MPAHDIAKHSVIWALLLLGFLYRFTTLEKLVVKQWGMKPHPSLLKFIRLLDAQ
jgi:hypothetical protein